MFSEDAQSRFIDAPPDALEAVYASINSPQVQVGGATPSPAKGVVCVLGAGPDAAVVVIGLCIESAGRNVVYRRDEGPCSRDELPDVLEEALAFAESMGFMIDSLNWPSLDDEHRLAVQYELKVFSAPEQRGRDDEPRLALARLLSSF